MAFTYPDSVATSEAGKPSQLPNAVTYYWGEEKGPAILLGSTAPAGRAIGSQGMTTALTQVA